MSAQEVTKLETSPSCGPSGTASTVTAFVASGTVSVFFIKINFTFLEFLLTILIGKGVPLSELATRITGSSDLYSMDSGTLIFFSYSHIQALTSGFQVALHLLVSTLLLATTASILLILFPMITSTTRLTVRITMMVLTTTTGTFLFYYLVIILY